MEIVGVEKVTARRAPHRPLDTRWRPWHTRRFWVYARIAVFITVFLAVFLLFPREAS